MHPILEDPKPSAYYLRWFLVGTSYICVPILCEVYLCVALPIYGGTPFLALKEHSKNVNVSVNVLHFYVGKNAKSLT